jgi:hypothetical protein
MRAINDRLFPSLNIRNPYRPSKLMGLVAAALLLAAQAWADLAPAQIDQSVLISPTTTSLAVSGDQSLSQTFVVLVTGFMTRIDLQMGRRASVAPLQFELRRTSGGSPDLSPQALLYSSLLDPNLFPVSTFPSTFTAAITLGAGGVPVTHGDRLAIVCSTTGDWYNWSSSGGDFYPYGSTFWKPASHTTFSELSGTDVGFQTWIAVPEPAGLLPLGLAAVLIRRRGARGFQIIRFR